MCNRSRHVHRHGVALAVHGGDLQPSAFSGSWLQGNAESKTEGVGVGSSYFIYVMLDRVPRSFIVERAVFNSAEKGGYIYMQKR
jgi:hypothetical protein